MSKIYRHPTQPTVDLPALDLLTFLFGKYRKLNTLFPSEKKEKQLLTLTTQQPQIPPTPSHKKKPSCTSTQPTHPTPSPNPKPETSPSASPMDFATPSVSAQMGRIKTS